jgi:uncharacterized protein (TIGR00106 family)
MPFTSRPMKATAEIQAIPIGAGVSVRREVQRAHELLEESGLILETHASGTNVEGDLAEILQAVERVHAVLHAEGIMRLITVVKLETRTDKEPTLAGKRL